MSRSPHMELTYVVRAHACTRSCSHACPCDRVCPCVSVCVRVCVRVCPKVFACVRHDKFSDTVSLQTRYVYETKQ